VISSWYVRPDSTSSLTAEEEFEEDFATGRNAPQASQRSMSTPSSVTSFVSGRPHSEHVTNSVTYASMAAWKSATSNDPL
jgi:hypothetical protein